MVEDDEKFNYSHSMTPDNSQLNGNSGVVSEEKKISLEPQTAPDNTVKKLKKSTKKSTKKSMDPTKLTPEYIEEQRRLRALKKEQKRQELLAQGIDPDKPQIPKALEFIQRPFVQINEPAHGLRLKIMSYNVLAQALIRRKLFPTSGEALKWSTRSQVLLAEIKYYDPDVLCVQELDFIQYNTFWKLELTNLGYDSKFHRSPSKNHGVCVFYKNSLFVCKHQSFINYDKEELEDITPRTFTQNVGLLTCLEFTSKVLQEFPTLSKPGIIIGTTHLFWHPFGTYERTRQTYIVLKKCKEFQHTINTLTNKDWLILFAGDFNSQPYDTPYLSITAKPVDYSNRGKIVIGCSLSYQYSRNRGMKEGDNEDNDNDNDNDQDQEPEEGGNIEKYGKNQPKDPVPDSFTPTEEQLTLVNKMMDLHNNLDMRAISLYSVGYNLVDTDNCGKDNDRNEPMYSNWAHGWRGLLDYIFLITHWNKQEEHFTDKVDSLNDIETQQKVRLLKLLRLPRGEEMGDEPSGQPRLGQYPSDHFALMSEIEIL